MNMHFSIFFVTKVYKKNFLCILHRKFLHSNQTLICAVTPRMSLFSSKIGCITSSKYFTT